MSRVIRKKTKQNRRRQANNGSLDDHLHEQLTQILISLAQLLLRNGYGYSKVNAVTKTAFVKAAADLHGETNRKRSIARIAALTGLTRLEVSRQLKAQSTSEIGDLAEINRAVRVAEGWQSDRGYAVASNKPRKLPFSGAKQSFTKLVQRYSGDIPVRAMAEEMKRLGLVTIDAGNNVSLVRSRLPVSRATISSLKAITPWIKSLSFRSNAGEPEQFSSKTDRIRMKFESLPQVRAAIREVETRRAAFVAGLVALSSASTAEDMFETSVSVALAASHPKRVKRKKQ